MAQILVRSFSERLRYFRVRIISFRDRPAIVLPFLSLFLRRVVGFLGELISLLVVLYKSRDYFLKM